MGTPPSHPTLPLYYNRVITVLLLIMTRVFPRKHHADALSLYWASNIGRPIGKGGSRWGREPMGRSQRAACPENPVTPRSPVKVTAKATARDTAAEGLPALWK
jgi:hypothetical protein